MKKIKNAGKGNLLEKIPRRIRYIWVSKLRNTRIYPYCYISYWHSIFLNRRNVREDFGDLYFAAKPNPGAGIGHQMANWISGYWFAKQFKLKFAHIPFSSEQWENFLGFGIGEIKVDDLKNRGYQVIRVPEFDEYNPKEVNRINTIIHSYHGTKTVFLAEQDQVYHDQFGVINELQEKFYSSPSRIFDKTVYQADAVNVAMHIRRGDIVENSQDNNPNLTMRYQPIEYFINALKIALEILANKKNIHIFIFSQDSEESLSVFKQFDNVHFCTDMDARESFLHMVLADVLITSKSSFSYKPALLNKGLKICPQDFWHGYPDSSNWVLLNDEGVKIKK